MSAVNPSESCTAPPEDQTGGLVTAAHVVKAAAAILQRAPAALVTDIDGTLSPIVSRPEDARVGPAVRAALERLNSRLALTAVITGRSPSDAREMVGVEGLIYVGHYGVKGDSDFAGANGLGHLKTRLQLEADGLEGVELEEKGLSFSLHYRHAADGAATRSALLEIAERIIEESGARIVEGKQVVELVPGGLPDKGDAIMSLLDEHGIGGVVYFGDDLSDIRAFEELERRRASGAGDSLTVAVVDAETRPEVRSAADLRLAGVPENERALTLLAAALESGATCE